jgi:hypothetical protein
MNGTNPVKDNSMSQQRVYNAQARAFVKGVAIHTGLGFKLWLDDDIDNNVEDDLSNNYILISSKDLTILNKVYNSLEARIIVNEDELQDMYSKDYYDNSSKYY